MHAGRWGLLTALLALTAERKGSGGPGLAYLMMRVNLSVCGHTNGWIGCLLTMCTNSQRVDVQLVRLTMPRTFQYFDFGTNCGRSFRNGVPTCNRCGRGSSEWQGAYCRSVCSMCASQGVMSGRWACGLSGACSAVRICHCHCYRDPIPPRLPALLCAADLNGWIFRSVVSRILRALFLGLWTDLPFLYNEAGSCPAATGKSTGQTRPQSTMWPRSTFLCC